MIHIDIHRHLSRLSMLLWLPLLTACADDLFSGPEPTDGELPVTFEFVLPTTRAAENDHHLIEDRLSFKDKDIIHIEGQFTIPGQDKKEIRYGAMTYDASKEKWTAAASSELTWPDEATGGTFKAYYLNPNGKDVNNENVKGGVIEKGGTTSTYSLSTLTFDTDPLKAEGEATSYGHAVKLEFSHLCTYLGLKGLGAPVSDQYWFTGKALTNSFYLRRNGDNTLTFTFQAHEDSRYKLVYISTTPNNGTAGFFLEPGRYDAFKLCYPAVEENYYEYIEYTSVPSENGPETGPELVANHSYLLDISKSKGITISSPPQGPEEETWDDSGDYIEVDVEKFLRAVAAGSDYDYNGTRILQGGNNATKLLHNISFHKESYTLFSDDDFEPMVRQNSVFDGGHHYISEIACPVFHRNMGTIRNLGLRNIYAEFISDEADLNTADKDVYDRSRNGILCGWNERGTIENIRIAGATITAKVKNDTETEDDKDVSQEAHSIGCVIGSNTGTVTDLALAGHFKLTVNAYTGEGYTNVVDASVMIGGIVGQNAENGTITNVSSYDAPDPEVGPLKFTITNNCSGEAGAFYVGGIAGSSSASIRWVTLPDITIDGSGSSCVAMYMGGIAGQLSATSSSVVAAATSSCNITGTVKAGTVRATNKADVTPKSYIGGVAGVLSQPITDCRTAVSVTVGTTANEGVTYATGGAFGRILKTAADLSIENIMAYGDKLEGPANFIGNFVGIAPVGETWESYMNHDIVVRNFFVENVGHNRDE